MVIQKESSADTVNYAALDGVRCLTSLAVILLHCHYLFGAPCMANLQRIPFAGPLLFRPSAHMTVFWMLSGFFCQHSLERLKLLYGNNSLSPTDHVRVFVRRLLRIYPLFAPLCWYMYVSGHQRGDSLSDEAKCHTLWRTLTFSIAPHQTVNCTGVAWSMATDVQGYFVLMLLSVLMSFTATTTNIPVLRKRMYWSLYAISVYSLLRTTRRLHHDHSSEAIEHVQRFGSFGLENLRDFERQYFDPMQFHPVDLYAELDIHSPGIVARQSYISDWSDLFYYTSTNKHGSAMLLGSLLYWNVHEKRSERKVIRLPDVCKVLAALFYLSAMHILPGFTGVAIYILLETLLLLPKGNLLSVFSNPLWSNLSQYTFAVFLTHTIFIGHRVPVIFENWIEKAASTTDEVSLCQNYTLSFLLVETFRAFVKSLLFSVLLHHTLERPFQYLRRRVLVSPTEKKKAS